MNWWEWTDEDRKAWEDVTKVNQPVKILVSTPNGPQTNKFKELIEHGKTQLVQEGDQHSTPTLSE